MEVLPDLQGSYDHAVAQKTQPLPDVAVEMGEASIVLQELAPEVGAPFFSVEQAHVRKWECKLLLMDKPEDDQAASEHLADWIDDLTDSVLNDSTLGGRVQWVGKNVRGGFDPPFVQFDDDTQGRLATLTIEVYEFIPIEE